VPPVCNVALVGEIVIATAETVVTVKSVTEVAVPPGVVTEIFPVVAPLGTAAVIWVALITENVAAAPLNATAVAPVRFVPLIVTAVPTGPDVGEKLVTVGATVTVKLVADVAVPPGVVTEIGPVAAPAGTVAVIWVALITENVAALPLNATAVAPVRFVPLIVTAVPIGPDVGEKLVTVGALVAAVTVKTPIDVAVPFGVVTDILPVAAALGTVAVIWVALLPVNSDAAEPLNATAVAPVRLVPVMTTEVPTGPEAG